MRYIYIILLVIVASSCATQKRCARKFPPQIKTEIKTVTEIVYKDTTIYVHIPGDTVTKEVIVYVTEDGSNSELSELHTEFAWSTAQVVNGILRHELFQKETEIERVIKNAVREQSTHTVEDRVEIHREKYIPSAYKYSFWLVLGLVVLGLVRLVSWLRR